MDSMNDNLAVAILAGAVRSGTALLYASVGEVLTERAGILNLGLEGIMLVGALTGVAVSFHTGRPSLGVVASLIAGAILGLLHAIICVHFRANQVVSGIAITIFGTGLSAFIGISYVGKRIAALAPAKIPFLGDVPVVGPILFSHDVLVYGTYVLVPLMMLLLYRTRFGLAVQATGEDPQAASTAGVNVELVRYTATTVGGALAGLGGAYLSLVYAQGWIENITAGRGLIAVGLVIFAAWNPWKAALGAYLFGGATSLQLRLQATGSNLSQYLLGMVPYLLVIVVLVVATVKLKKKRVGIPSALGLPYVRQI